MNIENLHSSYITGLRIDESFGKYRISCKVGSYCAFGFDQVSNQRHLHDCYEMCVILGGSGRFVYNGIDYSLQKGDIIVSDPGVNHEIITTPAEELFLLYLFIEIKNNNRVTIVKSFGDKCVESFLREHVQKIPQEHLLAYLYFIENYNSPKRKFHYGTYEAIRNLVLESLKALSNSAGENEPDSIKNIMEESLDYIDANLHKKILVREVAANCCTTRRNLEYLFSRQLKKTIIGYINEKKIELACHYLQMYFTVSDAANMVGISNPSQFSVLFKKYTSCSPRQYQKTHVTDGKGMGRRI